jgi:hypothetical protein
VVRPALAVHGHDIAEELRDPEGMDIWVGSLVVWEQELPVGIELPVLN